MGCQAAAGPNVGFPAPVLFTGLTPGQLYYVTISGYSSSDTSGPFTVAATSVLASRPATAGAALLVYPNPSNIGQLTLRLASNAPAQLALFNALGQVVRRQTLAAGSGEHSFGTRGLAAGVYILQVQAGSETLTRKVVVE